MEPSETLLKLSKLYETLNLLWDPLSLSEPSDTYG